ncbi:hypothetical protein GO730_00275 [Spirosoma sp. HMF3257]|uniref:T9SS C-terminal target domain-containing protein n=1 Tax=Spirosoma telluris TaxID=2183553 RepID=A0A327ND94_9BACT|nr:hypothetical protein [Spirosoma telluris]RAI73240.1 hypothetical protein HMF3257_00270 [Spirosoma telluris]
MKKLYLFAVGLLSTGLASGQTNLVINGPLSTNPSIYNTIIGNQAGNATLTGNSNVFLGYKTGFANTTGYSGVFLGTSAGAANTTGSGNTFVGKDAGEGTSTGFSNTFLGVAAGSTNGTTSSNVYVGPLPDHLTVMGFPTPFWETRRATTAGVDAVTYLLDTMLVIKII